MLPKFMSMYVNIHSRVHMMISCHELLFIQNRINIAFENMQIRNKSFKSKLDHSKVPKLNETDLKEQFVRGSGPGGQATNKTNNAVILKHKPTGLVVRCHETRSLWDNKKRAREIMMTKLDNLLNKEYSIEAQIHVLEKEQQARKYYKRKKLAKLKKAFQERENLA